MQAMGIGFGITFDVLRHRQSRLSLLASKERSANLASLGTAEVKAPKPLEQLLVS